MLYIYIYILGVVPLHDLGSKLEIYIYMGKTKERSFKAHKKEKSSYNLSDGTRPDKVNLYYNSLSNNLSLFLAPIFSYLDAQINGQSYVF